MFHNNYHYQEAEYLPPPEEVEEEEFFTDEEPEESQYYPQSEEGYFSDDVVSPPLQWRTLDLGEAHLLVSDEGDVRYVDSRGADLQTFFCTKGNRHKATPYRYVDVCTAREVINRYYVHDLVWMAFTEEDIPRGWKIRHHASTPLDEQGCLLNHLDFLDLVRSS